MEALRDFLNWFEGFADNIDEAPNALQWGKIKDRITRLREEQSHEPAAQASNGAAAQVSIGGANTAVPKNKEDMPLRELYLIDEKLAQRKWKERFGNRMAQLDNTLSKRDITDLCDTQPVNFDVEPEVAADQERATWAQP